LREVSVTYARNRSGQRGRSREGKRVSRRRGKALGVSGAERAAKGPRRRLRRPFIVQRRNLTGFYEERSRLLLGKKKEKKENAFIKNCESRGGSVVTNALDIGSQRGTSRGNLLSGSARGKRASWHPTKAVSHGGVGHPGEEENTGALRKEICNHAKCKGLFRLATMLTEAGSLKMEASF